MPEFYQTINKEKIALGFVAAIVFDDYEYDDDLYKEYFAALESGTPIKYDGSSSPRFLSFNGTKHAF